MASKEQLALLKKTISKDERLQRLKTAFGELPEYRLNLGDLHEEVDSMMVTRPIRSLDRRDASFIDAIVDAMMTDQQYRTRITEILMSCVKVEKSLSRSVTQISDYLGTEYHSVIYQVYKTKYERVAFIESVLRKYTTYLDKIDELKQRCVLLTTDIDKAGYMFKGLIETVQISARRLSNYE